MLTYSQWATILVCCLCGFLNAYDFELYPVTITQFQRDLNISETDIGLVSSAVRWGNALSLPICYLGDIYGRKRMMLVSSTLYLLFVSMCGLSQGVAEFTAMQLLARGFMAAQNTFSTTLLIEGLNAEDRGWGIGTYGSTKFLGAATVLLIFGFVGDLPDAWRGLFLSSGIMFLPLLGLISRSLPESKRFLEAKSNNNNAAGATISLRCDMLRGIYRHRTAICCIASALNGFAFAPAETYKIKKLVEVHHLTSAQISAVQLATGFLAFFGLTYALSASDRYGRKRFLVIFNTLYSLGTVGFFLSPESAGGLVYVMNLIQVLSGFVLRNVKAAYFAELFSTSNRASAQGWFVVCEFTFGAISLLVESALVPVFGEHWLGCGIIALPALFTSLLVACCLPEVSSLELEHVSPDHNDNQRQVEMT